MLRSLLTLLISMALAVACVVLSFSAAAEPYEARLGNAPAPATTRAKQPPQAKQRSHNPQQRVIKSTGVGARKRMHAERARGHALKARRANSPHATWESSADDFIDECDQLVPGSGVRFVFDDGGALGDMLVSGSVETQPPFGTTSGSERSVSSRPRSISSRVDVPPPRLG